MMQERHPSASRCPSGDREVTQKTSVLQRFVEYWFILAEAHLRWRGEDRKQKASALHPAAGAGAVHPPGTKAFLFCSLSSGRRRRRAGGEIAVIAAAELQPSQRRPDAAEERDEVLGARPDVPHDLYDTKLNDCPSVSRVSA